MCGISGFTWRSEPLGREMLEAIRHRGPDGQGLFVDDGVTLAHTRLAIIDLSNSGAQPMRAQQLGRNLVITFNGEIYNFMELRLELRDHGFKFESESDTEVILAAYVVWGSACTHRFNGMWAFAIWDIDASELFLSRDRFGKKPLYYARVGKELIFASEIKAILRHAIPRKANDKIVIDYLHAGMLEHTKDTFFEGVSMLPAGHNALYVKESGRLSTDCYYQPTFPRYETRPDPEVLLTLLTDAVRLRLIADVSVSVSLSGGTDSTSVSAIAAKMTRSQLQAFTLGGTNDELKLVKKLLVKYPEIELEVAHANMEDFETECDEVIRCFEQPFQDDSPYPRWQIARKVRESGYKVLVTGEGADEILGGYPQYTSTLIRDYFREPRHLGSALIREVLAHAFLRTGWTSLRQAVRLLHAQGTFPVIKETSAYGLYHPARRDKLFDLSKSAHELRLYHFRTLFLPYLLMCNDKISMAHGIEIRCPFMDYRVVEMCMRIGIQYLMRWGLRKHPLRYAARNLLPREISMRRQKDAFSSPFSSYLWSDQAVSNIRSTFLSSRAARFFDASKMLAAYESSRPNVDPLVQRAYLLERWMKIYDVV